MVLILSHKTCVFCCAPFLQIEDIVCGMYKKALFELLLYTPVTIFGNIVTYSFIEQVLSTEAKVSCSRTQHWTSPGIQTHNLLVTSLALYQLTYCSPNTECLHNWRQRDCRLTRRSQVRIWRWWRSSWCGGTESLTITNRCLRVASIQTCSQFSRFIWNKKCVTMSQMPPKTPFSIKVMPEVKVTVTQRQYATLPDPKVYPHIEFGIPTSSNIGDMLRRPEVKVTWN